MRTEDQIRMGRVGHGPILNPDDVAEIAWQLPQPNPMTGGIALFIDYILGERFNSDSHEAKWAMSYEEMVEELRQEKMKL